MPILTSLALGSTRGFGFAAGGASFITQTFHASGEFLVPTGVTEVEYLIVSGGGGTGAQKGGGGAGGLRFGTKYPVTPASSYTVTVGGGGAATSSPWATGTGSNSSIEGGSPVTHLGTNGGGAGAPAPYNNGGSGGGGSTVSGGGSAIALTPANGHSGSLPDEDTTRGTNVQGFAGGDLSTQPSPTRDAHGGGGGAAEAGQTGDVASAIAGNGGKGIVSEITGRSIGYGGGGGGGTNQFNPPNPNSRAIGGNSFTLIGAPFGGGNGGRESDSSPNVQDGFENTGGGGGSGQIGKGGGSGIVVLKMEAKESIPIVFEASGETIIPSGVSSIDYFVLSGGGAGGQVGGGGGGGGGIRLGTGLPVSKGDILSINIGSGGAVPTSPGVVGGSGGDSFISIAPSGTILGSNGGGGGGGRPSHFGRNGGCGGGAGGENNTSPRPGGAHSRQNISPYGPTAAYTPNSAPDGSLSAIPGESLTYTQQGYSGGSAPSSGGYGNWFAAGGGGAGGAGVNGLIPGSDFSDRPDTSHGGIGVFVNMSGTSIGYGGGGGGSTSQDAYSPIGVGGAGPYSKGSPHPLHDPCGPNYPNGTTFTGFYGGGNGIDENTILGPDTVAPQNSGVANSGGGGGGGYYHPTYDTPQRRAHAGDGGSGVIIIKFNV